jgi:Holliday junction resolvase-like predicted endonuclease
MGARPPRMSHAADTISGGASRAVGAAAGAGTARGAASRGPLPRYLDGAAGKTPSPPYLRGKGDDASVPVFYVNHVAKTWVFQFEQWIFEHQLIGLLFVGGELPAGMALRSRSGAPVEVHWTLSWAGRLDDHSSRLTPLGHQVRVRALTGEQTPEEAASEQILREQERERSHRFHEQRNKTFLPALGMSASEAMARLKPGAYVAAPGLPLQLLKPVGAGDSFPGDLQWLKPYGRDGWFVYRSPGGVLDMTRVTASAQFQKDMSWYLRLGYSLAEAQAAFVKQWDDLTKKMLIAFILAMSGGTPRGPRADLGESASTMAARQAENLMKRAKSIRQGAEDKAQRLLTSAATDAERRIVKAAAKEASYAPFRSAASRIDPLGAVQAALTGFAAYDAWKNLLEALRKDEADEEEQLELQSLNTQITERLGPLMRSLSETQKAEALRTGQKGEGLVRRTLEARGYAVIDLQNASGQGIDLVALKTTGKGKGLIVYVEVKSSTEGFRGRLSNAQKDQAGFVRDRLQRVVDRQGHYKNMDPRAIAIAEHLLAEIKAGRPIGGLRVTVKQLSKGLGFTIEFAHWKPPPKATVIRPARTK